MRGNESGRNGLQMTVAFIAGMVVMAALSQTPVGADIFSHQLIHETVVPVMPDSPDSLKPTGSPDSTSPVKPGINELVWTAVEEVALPG
jgi:hypothetical protein